MFGSTVLDIAIGLSFAYFLMSIVASAANELLAQIKSWRAATLRDGVAALLGDATFQGLARDVYEHPLISSLGKPSYLEATRFADALMGTLNRAQSVATASVETLSAAIDAIPDPGTRTQLQLLLHKGGSTLDGFRTQVAGWFDEGMDRLSGAYKRKARWVVLAVGIVMVLLFNFDSFSLANTLASSPSAREAIVAEVTATTADQGAQLPADAAIDKLNGLGYGIGWVAPQFCPSTDSACRNEDRIWTGFWYLITRIPGWVVTVLAISLGAPFWFQTLSRLTPLRSTGKKPGDSQ